MASLTDIASNFPVDTPGKLSNVNIDADYAKAVVATCNTGSCAAFDRKYEIIAIDKPNPPKDNTMSSLRTAVLESKFLDTLFKAGDVWCTREKTNYTAKEGVTAQADIEYFAPFGVVVDVDYTGPVYNQGSKDTVLDNTKIKWLKLLPGNKDLAGKEQATQVPILDFLSEMIAESGVKYPIYILRPKPLALAPLQTTVVPPAPQNSPSTIPWKWIVVATVIMLIISMMNKKED